VNATLTGSTPEVENCLPASNPSFPFEIPLGRGIHAVNVSLEHVTITDAIVATHLESHRSAAVGGFNLPGYFRPAPPGSIDESSYNFYAGGGFTAVGPGDQLVSPEVGLAPLGDNGGPIPTRSPTATSPLIDYIPLTQCPTQEDAHATVRPQGAACDVGAVEVVR
jgi:hypothetical protein